MDRSNTAELPIHATVPRQPHPLGLLPKLRTRVRFSSPAPQRGPRSAEVPGAWALAVLRAEIGDAALT